MSGPENVRITHRLLGSVSSEKQERIYSAYPAMRGVSDRELDAETFEAAFIMALTQTYPKNSKDPFKCYFFVPLSANKWAIEQFNVCTKKVFAKVRGMPLDKRAFAAKQVGKFIKCIMVGSRVLQLENGPDRWVAFGFEKSDPLPDWLREGLQDKFT